MAMIKVSPAVVPINQPTSASCWYVCFQMLWIWKKKDPSQILPILNADKDLFPEYWLKEGIAPYNCAPASRALGMGCAGDGDLDAGVLANALNTHGPYWVAGEWTKGSSHVIVVTGCDPDSGAIRYINPWCNYDLSDSGADIDWLNSRGSTWKNTFGSCIYWV